MKCSHILLGLMVLLGVQASDACTTIVVGKKASKNGAVIVSHSNDALRDQRIVRVPARDHEPGSVRNVYYEQPACGWLPEFGGAPYRNYVGPDRGPVYDTGEAPSIPLGSIPQVAHTYAYYDAVYPIMNEHQLSIGESTCKAKCDDILPATDLRLFYSSSLARVALERCRKARDAVRLMGAMIDEYGYYGTGECLVVADPEEAWVMEMCGVSTNGAEGLWVAQRVPDDAVVVSPNIFRIREVTTNSTDMLYSTNLFAVCQQNNWWSPEAGPLDWAATVGGGEYHHPYYSLRRIWRVLSRIAPSAAFSPDAPSAYTTQYPFAVKPDVPLSLQDVMALHRDHYEGTRFDLTTGAASGAFGNPTRYEQPGDSDVIGAFERSLSVYRCGYVVVNQSRSWLPDAVGGMMWIGFDKPSACAFMPVYAGVSQLPASFSKGNRTEFNAASMWWTFNLVANYAQLNYGQMIRYITERRQQLEAGSLQAVAAVEQRALERLNSGDPDGCSKELTQFSTETAQHYQAAWQALFQQLVMKYNDGYRVEPNGTLSKLGYPDSWLREVGYEQGPVRYDAVRPRIAVITTGGTIAMKIDPKTGGAVPALSGDALLEAVPALKQVADLEVISECNIDSSWMSPDVWLKLVKTVQHTVDRPEIDGVVITHGTDTMADTAYFLDLTVKTSKPVVLTGAMRNASEPGPDGPANLYSAVCQAAGTNTASWGVTVTLNNYIQSAQQVYKQNSMNTQAFESGAKGLLGTVYDGRVTRINERIALQKLDVPEQLARVPLLVTYVGDEGNAIRQAVASGVDGLVIEGFGAGNVNQAVAAAIETAVAAKIPVVLASMCSEGGAHPAYGSTGGGAELAQSGVILSSRLVGNKARILLSILLGLQTPDSALTDWF